MKTRKWALCAVLAAAALILYAVEALLPPLTAIPGIKLGLANVVTVFALYALGPWYALTVLAVRIAAGSLITGQLSALAYSAAGGAAAWALSWLLSRFLKQDRAWVVSAFAAIAHNAAQVLCAVLVTRTAQLWWYLPVLVAAAVPAGAATGAAAQLVLRHTKKLFSGRP